MTPEEVKKIIKMVKNNKNMSEKTKQRIIQVLIARSVSDEEITIARTNKEN